MGKFRKKPVVIEASRYPGHFISGIDALLEFEDWFNGSGGKGIYTGQQMQIATLEGVMTAEPGDWIIKGVKGEFYPCKPDIFEATYEAV